MTTSPEIGKVSQQGDGRFFANVGYSMPGSRQQPKFMLGRDRAAAIVRAATIEVI